MNKNQLITQKQKAKSDILKSIKQCGNSDRHQKNLAFIEEELRCLQDPMWGNEYADLYLKSLQYKGCVTFESEHTKLEQKIEILRKKLLIGEVP